MPLVQRMAYRNAAAEKERQSLSEQIEAKRKTLVSCDEAKMDVLERHQAASTAMERIQRENSSRLRLSVKERPSLRRSQPSLRRSRWRSLKSEPGSAGR